MKAPKGSMGVESLVAGGLLAVAPLVSGCDWITQKITQKATEAAVEHVLEKETGGDVKLDTSNGSVSVKSNKGSLEINDQGAKLPEHWPKDVPVYPGAKIRMAMGAETGQQLFLETPDSAEKAVEFYKTSLSAFEQEAIAELQGSHVLRYKDKAAGRTVHVTVSRKNENPPSTSIMLITGTDKKSRR